MARQGQTSNHVSLNCQTISYVLFAKLGKVTLTGLSAKDRRNTFAAESLQKKFSAQILWDGTSSVPFFRDKGHEKSALCWSLPHETRSVAARDVSVVQCCCRSAWNAGPTRGM